MDRPRYPHLTIQQQCELLGLPRSTYYYRPRLEGAENLRLMRRLDELNGMSVFRQPPHGCDVGGQPQTPPAADGILGIEALYPKPNLSGPAPGHEIYPYLLRGRLDRAAHVWSNDITYVPVRVGFLYLVAVMDWFSRFVLSWVLSNTMQTSFCLAALQARSVLANSKSGTPIRVLNSRPRIFSERVRRQYQHGRARPRPGQCVHRAAVAQLEVRAHLSRRLRQWGGFVSGAGSASSIMAQKLSQVSGVGQVDVLGGVRCIIR